jgi:hypothetical protein
MIIGIFFYEKVVLTDDLSNSIKNAEVGLPRLI